MDTIVLVVATRPNFVKAAPVYKALKNLNKFNITIVHTNQHYDKNMSDIFLDLFNLETTKLDINLKNITPNTQLALIMQSLEKYLKTNKNIKLIITFGDVTSSLATALTANKLGIKLAHVESGLRSYDKTMPEENNRLIIDHLSDYLFVTEKSSIINLNKENIYNSIYFVGNSMIDSLLANLESSKKLNNKYSNYILVTLHRPNNVDDIVKLTSIISKLAILADKYTIIFPVHPRRQKVINSLVELNHNHHSNIILLEPQGYLEFLNLEINSKLIITDGAGVIEEAAYLDIPCLVLRPNIERLLTSSRLVEVDELNLQVIEDIIKNKVDHNLELWDGKSGIRIANIIDKIISIDK